MAQAPFTLRDPCKSYWHSGEIGFVRSGLQSAVARLARQPCKYTGRHNQYTSRLQNLIYQKHIFAGRNTDSSWNTDNREILSNASSNFPGYVRVVGLYTVFYV